MCVEIFTLYIFRVIRDFQIIIRENMYNLKITCFMSHRGNEIKDANLNPRELPNFRKIAKIYTCENIYFHSTQPKMIRTAPTWWDNPDWAKIFFSRQMRPRFSFEMHYIPHFWQYFSDRSITDQCMVLFHIISTISTFNI